MLRILHISDMHFGKSVSFDQDQVQRALLDYIEKTTDAFHALAITGDIAYSGRASEYLLAEEFIRPLMKAMALTGEQVAICPGNHDVDRLKVSDLARTLPDTQQSDRYFTDGQRCLHIEKGQQAFVEFYQRLLNREYSALDSINGPIAISSMGVSVELFELNTAIFARADDDHGQLWVGRASLSRIETTESSSTAPIKILLGHHPFEWLASEEESRVRALAEQRFAAFMRGHLHQGGYAATSSGIGDLIQIAAGSLYQGASRPIEANVVEIDPYEVLIRPIRYIDEPLPAWVPDNGKLGPSAATQIGFKLHRGLESSIKVVNSTSPGVKEFRYSQLFSNNEGKAIFVAPRLGPAQQARLCLARHSASWSGDPAGELFPSRRRITGMSSR